MKTIMLFCMSSDSTTHPEYGVGGRIHHLIEEEVGEPVAFLACGRFSSEDQVIAEGRRADAVMLDCFYSPPHEKCDGIGLKEFSALNKILDEIRLQNPKRPWIIVQEMPSMPFGVELSFCGHARFDTYTVAARRLARVLKTGSFESFHEKTGICSN